MEVWWSSLSNLEKAFWFITLPASVIFLIQMILTFIGMDSTGDMDGSADGGEADTEQPFQLFTFRNLINFLLGFGWTGIALHGIISNSFVLVSIATIVGALLVFLVMWIFYSLSKMQQSGNMDIKNAVHQIAEVYLTIPQFKTGTGIIQVRIQGALREVDAVTEGESIISGRKVRVVSILHDKLLVVEPL